MKSSLLLFAAVVTFAAFGSAARADDPQVVLHTSLGDITLELDPTHAPISTANFLRYVDAKKYDGTIFHRIMAGFMAQGGGFKPDMTEIEYFPPIHNEADNGLHNVAGTISMARTNDPESATGQFFLNFVNNSEILDKSDTNAGYAVFGRIVDGMDVLDKMAQVETTMSPMGEKSVPVQQVLLITARRK